MINIKVVGDRAILFDLERMKRGMPGTIGRIVRRSALHIEREVKLNLSGRVLHVRTNRLRGSIATVFGGPPDSPYAIIGTNVVYAPVHEFGAIIRARNVKYLRFKVGGQWVTTKQVRIPARPFMKKAFEESLSAIDRIADEEIDRVIR